MFGLKVGGQGMMMLCVEAPAGKRTRSMRAPLPVWDVAGDGDSLGLQGSRRGWWELMEGMEKWTPSTWRRLGALFCRWWGYQVGQPQGAQEAESAAISTEGL